MLGSALKRAQHAYRTRLDTALRPLGLTAPKFAVLLTVASQPGVSNAGLARAAFVTAQTMQGILSALENGGLLVRAPHAQHGRILETTLTEQGSKLLIEARAVVTGIEGLLAAAVHGEEEQIVRLLDRIVDRLTD